MNDVPIMQKKTKLLSFFQNVSALGKGEAVVFVAAVLFNTISKPAALYFACTIAFINFIMNELKGLYADPRPYWVSN